MLIAGYIHNHKKDSITSRMGWAIIRAMQKGEYKDITHTECILAGDDYRWVTIGSSSVRDGGGVRVKQTKLTPGHWRIFDVPQANVDKAYAWFKENDGKKYDWAGAIGTIVITIDEDRNKFFCNESDGRAIGIKNPEQYTPSQFIAIVMSFAGSIEVTKKFFRLT